MVLVGAEGVVENGGVINKLGTYQAALSAHCHNTPFYVAAESYKASVCLSRTHFMGRRCSAIPCNSHKPLPALLCAVCNGDAAMQRTHCSAAVLE